MIYEKNLQALNLIFFNILFCFRIIFRIAALIYSTAFLTLIFRIILRGRVLWFYTRQSLETIKFFERH
ncbi:MAG: hypothetical protein JWN60_1226 [Acidobacteria bacterium]|nr:hypothetical protein [Acidobacteriota bacterium]